MVSPWSDVIATDTGSVSFTEAVSEFEVIVFPEAQVALEVKVQVTVSPFAGG